MCHPLVQSKHAPYDSVVYEVPVLAQNTYVNHVAFEGMKSFSTPGTKWWVEG